MKLESKALPFHGGHFLQPLIKQMTFPNLGGVIKAKDVFEKGSGSYTASYVAWAKTSQLLRDHAPGWYFHLAAKDGNYVWEAPDGTGYLMGYFAVDREHREAHGNMPLFPFPIMDNRNNPIPCEKISARVFTDSHRRALCACAAFTFGLAYELWAKEEIENLGATPKAKPAIKTAPPKTSEDGEALTKQFIAYVKKNPDKADSVKTRLSDRYSEGKINDKQRDLILQTILEVEDK